MSHPRATQIDVARMAGVSQTTVSMVLNGTGVSERRVSEAVRRRVMDAIEESGYTANPIAQRLVGGRTSIVGVYTYGSVFPQDSADFYHPFLEGVERSAAEAGVDLLLFTSMDARRREPLVRSGDLSRLRIADGCVLLGRQSSAEDLSALTQFSFPFAFVGRRQLPDGGDVPYAGADYLDATSQLVQRLFLLGHRRIALVMEESDHESVVDRCRGYHRAIESAGVEPMLVSDLHGPSIVRALRAARITAVVASPALADDVRTAALTAGLSVPGDLSIARLGDPETPGSDDVEWSGFEIPRQEMGAGALRIVLNRLGADPVDASAPASDLPPASDLHVSVPCIPVLGATVSRPETRESPEGRT